MANISTHILDTSKGAPATGVNVKLLEWGGESWQERGSVLSNEDGRIPAFTKQDLNPGIFRLIFETGEYYARQEEISFYPFVEITFQMLEDVHHHVPLLLNPFGYTTYRGS